MKRKMMMALLAAAFCAGSSMTAFAMPEQMPDGGVFDAEYYAEENPDVAAVMGNGKDALYQHYTACGKAEGRLPGVFDAEYYAANNPDVVAVIGTDGEKLYQHYMLCGKSEGRIPGVPGAALKPIKPSAPAAADSESDTSAQQQNKGIQGVLGETYTMLSVVRKVDSATDSYIYRESAVNVTIEKRPLTGFGDGYSHYIIGVKMDAGKENHWDGWYSAKIRWSANVERGKNWTDWERVSDDKARCQFTVTQDGVDYPYCKLTLIDYNEYYDEYYDERYDDFYDKNDLYWVLPQNYNGEIRLTVYATKLDENGKPVKDEQNFITYVLP